MTQKPLRLVFMGTPGFSVAALRALLAAGHEVVAVYSQPPRKAGRGQKLTPGPVHAFAESQGLNVRTPLTLKDADAQHAFAALNADAAVVVAYGLILPKAILDAPKLGCFNIHASLLPRWRGAAPIQRAIEAGDRQSGITIMHMDEGLDTGPMVLVETVDMDDDMNAQQLHDTLSALGARMIVDALAGVANGTLTEQPQPEDGVTYAKKIDKSETRIDWRQSAATLSAQVRAFYPMTWFERGGQRVRVCAARVEPGSGQPGQVLDDALLIACGDGAVRLIDVQPAGKNVMGADAYVRGNPLHVGETLA